MPLAVGAAPASAPGVEERIGVEQEAAARSDVGGNETGQRPLERRDLDDGRRRLLRHEAVDQLDGMRPRTTRNDARSVRVELSLPEQMNG